MTQTLFVTLISTRIRYNLSIAAAIVAARRVSSRVVALHVCPTEFGSTLCTSALGVHRAKAVFSQRMVREIHALTAEALVWQETTALVGKLNHMLRGWANYFQVGTVNRAYHAIDNYTTMRLRRWLRNKHKVRCTGYMYYPDSHLFETLRLV